MPRTSRLLALTLGAALAWGALGCNAAFKNALEAGNHYASAGSWDEAAEAYKRAVDLEPEDEEARALLEVARYRQSEERVRASRAHLARGELAPAVKLGFEAYALYPRSTEALAAYNDARARAFVETEERLTAGKLKEARELARVLRKVNPNDRPAVDLEGRVLDAIAARAYDRATAFIAQEKPGNALLALRDAREARPGFRDVEAREKALLAALEDELRFIVVIERASGADQTSLSTRVEDTLLRWEPDQRYRLSAATARDLPAGPRVARVQPGLSAIARDERVSSVARSCGYTCGADRVPNPAYEVAARRAAAGERRMAAADAAAARARGALDRARERANEAAAALQAQSATASRARADLDACEARKGPNERCDEEARRHEEAKSASEAAAQRSAAAAEALARADDDVKAAEREKDSARFDWNQALSDLGNTPATVLVDRICTLNYGVEVHTFVGGVNLLLQTQRGGDSAPVTEPLILLTTTTTDEAFRPIADRCAEVAAGDPLVRPTDESVELALASRAVATVQDRVAGWYAAYVEGYRSRYEAEKTAGREEEANEAYVRYLLVGRGWGSRR